MSSLVRDVQIVGFFVFCFFAFCSFPFVWTNCSHNGFKTRDVAGEHTPGRPGLPAPRAPAREGREGVKPRAEPPQTDEGRVQPVLSPLTRAEPCSTGRRVSHTLRLSEDVHIVPPKSNPLAHVEKGDWPGRPRRPRRVPAAAVQGFGRF